MASKSDDIAACLSARVLLLLGEATSKCDHIARIPFPDFAAGVDARSIALCAVANTAIAGYRLSQALAADLRRECIPDADRPATNEGDKAFTNVVRVLIDDFGSGDPTVEAVSGLNERLVAGLAGRTGRTGREPSGTPAVWKQHVADALAASAAPDDDPTVRMRNAFVRATRLHLFTVRHRPFAAGNGRTARLLEAAVLVRAGFPLRVSALVACRYAEDVRRYRAMVTRCASGIDTEGDADNTLAFLEYSVAGFVGILRDELEHVMQPLWMRQQARLIWRQFVASQFAGVAPGPDTTRRCQLASELPENGVARSPGSVEFESDLVALEHMRLVWLENSIAVPRLDRVPLWLAPF